MMGGHAWQGDAWQGGCVAGGVHGRGSVGDVHGSGGGHAWQRDAWQGVCVAGGMCGRRDGHCNRRYASYWNAFLFINFLPLQSVDDKAEAEQKLLSTSTINPYSRST